MHPLSSLAKTSLRWTKLCLRWGLPVIFLALIMSVTSPTSPVAHAGNNGGNALDFDGTNDYVNIGNIGMNVSSFTIEMWIKPDFTTSDMRIISDISGSTNDFGTRFQAGSVEVWNPWLKVTSSTIPVGQWTHIAITKNGTSTTGFVNGVQEDTVTTNAINAAPLGIGATFLLSYGTYFNGQMDEVRFWSVPRTAAQIQADMYKELSGAESNLLAYYKFNESSGSTTAADSSGHGRTGTLTSMDINAVWVPSSAPIGDSTAAGQTGVTAFWVQKNPSNSGGLTIANNTFLVDVGDDIVFGHNNLDGKTNANVPTSGVWASAPNPQRWNREWYCDLTDQNNNGGTVNLTFDFDDAGMPGVPGGALSNYRLLERPTTSDQFTDLGGATFLNATNHTVTFTGVSVSSLCSYLTLGTLNDTDSPTAVMLSSFSAHPAVVFPVGLFLGVGILVAFVVFWRRKPSTRV